MLGDWLVVDTAAVIIAAWAIYERGKLNGRHRQAATAVQGDPANRAGGADARTLAEICASADEALDALAAASGYLPSGTGAGVMAAMKKPPTGNWSSVGSPTVLMKCQICGVPGLPAPGGVCSACAIAMGMPGVHKCPQCGSSYSTTDAACPACMAKMMQIMFRTTIAPASSASITHFPRQEPEPLPRADMQVRDVIGWRVWRITSLGYLRSLTADAIWLPGVPMEATGVSDSITMTTPGPSSAFGIHVFAERNGAVLEVENYVANDVHRNAAGSPSYAIGSVLLWGEVVEHERGYRAERAKIKSIDDVTWRGKPPWDKETAEVLGFLRARYGVPVPRGTITEGASDGE